jgi:hypothetical protein
VRASRRGESREELQRSLGGRRTIEANHDAAKLAKWPPDHQHRTRCSSRDAAGNGTGKEPPHGTVPTPAQDDNVGTDPHGFVEDSPDGLSVNNARITVRPPGGYSSCGFLGRELGGPVERGEENRAPVLCA